MNWRKAVDRFLKRWGGFLIKAISETTRVQTMSLIADLYEEGAGADKLARELEKRLGAYNFQRGRKIARTEVVRASNLGTFEGLKEAEFVEKKEWIATRDDRTRDTHLAADGQIVDLDKPFIVHGFETMYPASAELPAHESISCRCTFGGIVEGEGRTFDERTVIYRKTEKTRLQYQKWATRVARTMLSTVTDDIVKAVKNTTTEAEAKRRATAAIKKDRKLVRAMLETIYGRVLPDFAQEALDQYG